MSCRHRSPYPSHYEGKAGAVCLPAKNVSGGPLLPNTSIVTIIPVLQQVDKYLKILTKRFEVIFLTEAREFLASRTAVDINAVLKRKRKQIEVPDLFIAATAITNNLPLATLNRKHFDRIDNLQLVD